MKIFRATVVTVLLILLIPEMVFCRTELIIKPKISAAGRYDSNFYLSDDNKTGVYSYLVQPGIQFGFKAPKTQVSLNYDFEAYFYDGEGSEFTGTDSASELNYFGHLFSLGTTYKPTAKLTIGLDDAYYRTRYPQDYDRLSDNTNDILYQINRMTPSILYNFNNRFSLGMRYRRSDIWYEDALIEDSTEQGGLLDLIYIPTRKTSIGLEYQKWWVDYQGDSGGYTSDQLGLNFQKRFKYYTFDANTGYHVRSFDDGNTDSADTLTFKVSFTGQNPPPPDGRRAPGQYAVRSKSHFYVAAERNFNNYGTYFTADRFTMSIGHVFARKILARIKGYYQMNNYEQFDNADREDRIYNVSGTLSYLIKKDLSLSFTAGHEERDSTLSGLGYENTFFTVTLDFNYDFTGRGGYTEEALYY